MIIYPPEPQSGLHITGLRSIYVRGQMIIKGGGGSRGVIQRQAGSETARSSRLTSGSNLNLTTRSAVCSSQYGLQLPLKPQTAYRTTAASPPVSLYTSKLLSLISSFSTSFLSPHAHSGSLYVTQTYNLHLCPAF